MRPHACDSRSLGSCGHNGTSGGGQAKSSAVHCAAARDTLSQRGARYARRLRTLRKMHEPENGREGSQFPLYHEHAVRLPSQYAGCAYCVLSGCDIWDGMPAKSLRYYPSADEHATWQVGGAPNRGRAWPGINPASHQQTYVGVGQAELRGGDACRGRAAARDSFACGSGQQRAAPSHLPWAHRRHAHRK
jgi:hypothetical protein